MAVIAGKPGRIHHAIQHPALAKTRPVYCWIPEAYFEPNGFNKSRYLFSRWPSANCAANPMAVGSHVIPDPGKPVSNRNRCPVLREFRQQLEIVASVKIPPT